MTDVRKYEDFKLIISALSIEFLEEWTGKEKIIEVNADWICSAHIMNLNGKTYTVRSKQFLCNEKGFKQACAWIDGQREEFARTLLV